MHRKFNTGIEEIDRLHINRMPTNRVLNNVRSAARYGLRSMLIRTTSDALYTTDRSAGYYSRHASLLHDMVYVAVLYRVGAISKAAHDKFTALHKQARERSSNIRQADRLDEAAGWLGIKLTKAQQAKLDKVYEA